MYGSRLLLASALACAATGCWKDTETLKRDYFESGRKYVTEGKLAEAAIQFRSAIQQDANYGEARYQLAETLRATGDVRGAYREYIRAADLLPANAEAQLKAAGMYLLAGQFEDARARALRALDLEPKNVEAHIVMGAALAGVKQLDAAIRQVENAIELDPDRGLTYTNLGAIHLAQGKTAEAEASFKRATEIDPKSLPARIALANFYWSSGKRQAAEDAVKEALALAPDDVTLNRMMAFLYIASNRAAEAEPHLKTVANRTQDPTARVALADYYRQTKRIPEALKVLDQLAADEKTFGLAAVRRALIFYGNGEKAQAQSTVEDALQRDPKNVAALLLKAQFLVLEQKVDEALKAAQAAVTADPNAVPAHFAVGRIQAARGSIDGAIAAYTEVLKLSPRLFAAQLELARLHLAAGRVQDAARFADEAIRMQPENPEALLVRARTELASGDAASAEETLKGLAAKYPGAAIVHAQIGTLHAARNNATAARAAYTHSLELDEFNQEALMGLLLLDAREKNLPAAQKRIETRLAKRPDSPAILLTAAQTYGAIGDLSKAESTLRRVIEIQPSSIQAYGLLGQFYVSQRRTNEAIAEFEHILERNPKSVAAHTLIGMLLEANNRRDEARRQYERALEVDPRSPVPANNLAWMYAERGEDLDAALQLAQVARIGLPESAAVADTLGWIYYKKGQPQQAVAALRDAVRRQPNDASMHFHLGLALMKVGDLRQARQTLERGLQLSPNGPAAEEARSALTRISAGGS
jgi:tetratricopeptide (TPR) repeat protein